MGAVTVQWSILVTWILTLVRDWMWSYLVRSDEGMWFVYLPLCCNRLELLGDLGTGCLQLVLGVLVLMGREPGFVKVGHLDVWCRSTLIITSSTYWSRIFDLDVGASQP